MWSFLTLTAHTGLVTVTGGGSVGECGCGRFSWLLGAL